jgi:RHS repeat-associated protein
MKNIRLILFLTVAAFLFPSTARAQSQHLNQSRGFESNGVYSSKEIDNINLFNGNLTLTIPIGSAYKTGGNFSYSLTLVYNSNLWNQKEICTVGSSANHTVWTKYGSQGEILWIEQPFPNGNDGEIITPRDQNNECFTISEPNPETNAGMGWQLTLGRLYPPRLSENDFHPLSTEKQNWVYVSPDGAEHSFYNKLHETDSDPGTGRDDPVTYTRDGSYLRMRVDGASRLVEFPNGDVHRFSNYGTNNAPDWRVVRMNDQFGNYVDVLYEDRDNNGTKDWVLRDELNREQIIYFSKPAAGYQAVVDYVALTAFNNTNAVYNFNYENRLQTRAAPHVPNHPDFPAQIQVPYLTSVQLPDGSKYEMPSASAYDFDGVYSTLKSRGIIRSISLPTGGRIDWDYRAEDNPETADVDESKLFYGYPITSSARAYKRRSVGVRRRKVTEGNNVYVWSYDPRPELPRTDDPNCPFNTLDPACLPKEMVNKVTTPEGHYSLHYFSMYPSPAFSQTGRTLSEWHISEYGLPLTKYQTINDATGKPLFLSEQFYENKGSGYDLARSTYVRYETDEVAYNDGYGSVVDSNRRVVAKRTVYNDDGNRFAEVRYSQFDGLGHYRRSDTDGNFGSGDVRTERTNYNPATCTYLINPATNAPDTSPAAPFGHCYVEFPTYKPWVLGTYDSTVQVEGGESSKTLFYFDDFGQLLRKRVLKNKGTSAQTAANNPNDVVNRYSYLKGDLVKEESFGGDKQTLDTTQPLGTMALPASEFTVNHTYQHGILNTSQQVGVLFKSLNLEIDFSTGLPLRSRDQSEDPVTYAYDQMGRVTDIAPRQGSVTKIFYQPFNPFNGSLANVTVQRKPNAGGNPLDEEIYVYDQLGKLASEKQKMPGGSFMERVFKYNGSGWQTSVSEWGNPAKKTSYELYDPFGRAQKIVPPDGSAHITWMTYKGEREVKKEVKTATTLGVEESVVSTEFYDRQGRLNSVEEDSDYVSIPNSPRSLKTFYSYDVGNRLQKVSTTAAGGEIRPNVAAAANGAIATASSTVNQNYPAAAAINGDRTGKFWANGGGWNDASQGVYSTDWLQVNFNGGKSLKEIDVYTLRVGYATKPDDPTADETFNNADNGNQGIIDFDVQYLSNQGWKIVPGGRVTGNNKVWRKFVFTPVTTTAIRVVVHKAVVWTTVTNNYSRIVEIEAYDTANANVARQQNGGTTVASSEFSTNYPAGAVIDGDRRGFNWGNGGYGSGWADATEGVYASDWLQVDFGAVKSIEEINVFTLQDNFAAGQEPTLAQTFSTADNTGQGITYFEVQYLNGTRWQTVPNGLVTGNDKVWRNFTFAPISARYIRVVVRDAAVWTNIANNYSRIVEIEAFGPATTASGTQQTRQFNYDNRGFLTSETQPELGASGNGTIQYLDYDSRGSVGRKIDGANHLRFTYDAAGRTTLVEEQCIATRPCVGAINNWQALKEYTYYTDNYPNSGLFRLGKPATATRHNRLTNPNSGSPVDVTFSEAYDYWGMDGRMSLRVSSTSLGTTFQQTFAYDQMGNLESQTYPICVGSSFCAQSNVSPARTIINTYSNGLLTKVASPQNNYARQISYNPNGTIGAIAHGQNNNLAADGVTDTYEMDTNYMARARRIYTGGVGGGANWDSGTYQYDGAGNVKRIGADWYIYDRVNRVVEGTSLAPWKKKQKYTYDPFGNITKKETFANVGTTGEVLSESLPYSVNSATNRFNFAASNAYDSSGNLMFGIYAYDAVNMMRSAPGKIYLYNAADERMWTYDYSSGNPASYRDTIVLRGLNNEVLREYQVIGGNTSTANWSWTKDYVYAGTKLLSSEGPEGRRNFHPDHLGSPRLVTDNSFNVVSANQYLPFGEVASGANGERLDFTGHEKDLPNSAGGHTLLYMHARFYSASNGKFLSVDPGRDWDKKKPQSWNMYSYVRNNPVNTTDPNGRVGITSGIGLFVMTYQAVSYIQAATMGPPTPPLLGLASDVIVDFGARAHPYFAPEVARKLNTAIRQLNGIGIYPKINQAYRTEDDQQRMRDGASGSNPAAAGTSLHQTGYAVDFNGTKSAEFTNIKSVMKLNGFSWGGNFNGKKDPPHFYINPFGRVGTETYRQNVDSAAAEAGDFYQQNLAQP